MSHIANPYKRSSQTLDAGQERTVSLQLGKEAFCLWNQKMKYVAEPGVFRIELSDSAQTIWKGEFTLCI